MMTVLLFAALLLRIASAPHGQPQSVSGTMPLSSSAAASDGRPSPISFRVQVFSAGAGGCAAFRIPALVAAGDGVLLAFAECRKWTCNDYGRHDLVMRRSTNSGKSFGALTTLLEPNSHWTDCNRTELAGVPNLSEGGMCYGGCAVWDPTALADRNTGTVWLWFGRSTSSCPGSQMGGRRVDLWALKSTDRGLSFHQPMNMTSQCSTPYGGCRRPRDPTARLSNQRNISVDCVTLRLRCQWRAGAVHFRRWRHLEGSSRDDATCNWQQRPSLDGGGR